MGEMRNSYKILVVKPERKSPFGRPRCRWEANIKLYLKERLWVGFILLRTGISNRLCKLVMHLLAL
jgi:hypothetical protein